MSDDETIKDLRKEVEKLKNENESLWFMLDELKKSNIANHQSLIKNAIEKQVKQIKEERVKMPKVVGKAWTNTKTEVALSISIPMVEAVSRVLELQRDTTSKDRGGFILSARGGLILFFVPLLAECLPSQKGNSHLPRG